MTKVLNKKLSLCMIVKNEEKNLSACLDSVQDVANEILILDTGSTDNTVSIAKNSGAIVRHFKWCDDFSAARNESIKHARGEWILWLDGDEQLDENSKQELRTICDLSGHPIGVDVIIRNFVSDKISYGNAYRLFSNHHDIVFQNIIHEQVSFSLKSQKARIVKSNIFINHFGYDENVFDQDKKRNRNLPLLKKMVSENPDQPFYQFLLAQHFSGDTLTKDKAIYHFTEYINSSPKDSKLLANAHSTLSKIYFSENNMGQAKEHARHSLRTGSIQFDSNYLLANIDLKEKKYDSARNRFDNLQIM